MLGLDELGTCDARDVGKVIYDLFGGRGKSRLNKSSLLQANKTWRIQCLSNGGISLKQKIEEGGSSARTGQLIRMLDIPIDDGVIDPGYEEPRKLVEELKVNAEKFYGVAGPAFIDRLIKMAPEANSIRNKIVDLMKWRSNTMAQSRNLETSQWRALGRIDLVTVAGCLAADMGILPGTHQHVIKATRYIAE